MQKCLLTMANNQQITIELYKEHAEKTVENFIKLVNDKYYDNKTFHRVIDGFVSQGGCPIGNGSGDLGYTIKCETNNNPLKHIPGALSMAHRGKDTGCCQFFIVHDNQPHLDGIHTVFGQVIDNLDAVLKMKNGDIIKSIKMI